VLVAQGCCLPFCKPDGDWGSFPVDPQWRDTGSGQTDELLNDFVFIDRRQKSWTARRGLAWDGASIPMAVWSFFGSPKMCCHKRASIVHDWYYANPELHGEERKDVDVMYYEACRAMGVEPAKAAVMYWAVRVFGASHWDDDAGAASAPVELTVTRQVALMEGLEEKIRDGFLTTTVVIAQQVTGDLPGQPARLSVTVDLDALDALSAADVASLIAQD